MTALTEAQVELIAQRVFKRLLAVEMRGISYLADEGFEVSNRDHEGPDGGPEVGPQDIASLSPICVHLFAGADHLCLQVLGDGQHAHVAHDDSSTHGRPESVLRITVEVPLRGGDDSRPCACGGAK